MPLKSIRSRADLAISGAPPVFDEPLHIGRLNIGNRDGFWTLVHEHRFTNMSMPLFSASVIILLIGLLPDQITALTRKTDAWNVFGDFRVSMTAGPHGG